MTFLLSFGDIAHLGHVELLGPKVQRKRGCFAGVMGLHESGRDGFADGVSFHTYGTPQTEEKQICLRAAYLQPTAMFEAGEDWTER